MPVTVSVDPALMMISRSLTKISSALKPERGTTDGCVTGVSGRTRQNHRRGTVLQMPPVPLIALVMVSDAADSEDANSIQHNRAIQFRLFVCC